MISLSRSFLNEILHNPGYALLVLRRKKSRFRYALSLFFIYWRVVFSEYILNHCITRSSALAYALLLTLIPLITTAAFMIAGFIEVQPEQVRSFFALLLPFGKRLCNHATGDRPGNGRGGSGIQWVNARRAG